MGKGLRIGKSGTTGNEAIRVQGLEPCHHRTDIACKPRRIVVDAGHAKDIACQGVLKLRFAGHREGRAIGGLPTVKRLAKTPHFPRHGQIAGAHFAQVVIKVAAKDVK